MLVGIYPSFLHIFLSVCYKKDTVPGTGATEEKVNHCCPGDACSSFNTLPHEKWARYILTLRMGKEESQANDFSTRRWKIKTKSAKRL